MEMLKRIRDDHAPPGLGEGGRGALPPTRFTVRRFRSGEDVSRTNAWPPASSKRSTREVPAAITAARTSTTSPDEQLTFICTRAKDDAASPTTDGSERGYQKSGHFPRVDERPHDVCDPFIMASRARPSARSAFRSRQPLCDLEHADHDPDGTVLQRLDDRRIHEMPPRKADLNPARRYICHFPEDTPSGARSAYGGNALLGKKCLALRIGTFSASSRLDAGTCSSSDPEPEGDVHYIAAAFPARRQDEPR